MFHRLLLTGAALLAIAACADAASAQTSRDLTTVQSQALQVAKPVPGSLSILTLLDRADATYAIGETVRIGVKTNEDAYVTVLNIGPSGKVTQLFPNAFQANNFVKGGETVEIPAPGSGASIAVSGPVGAELIKIIATSKPMVLIPDGQWQGTGAFKSLDGDVGALSRDLAVVASNPPPATKVAISDQIIRTIAARETAAPAALVLVPVQPPAPAPVPPTFPLLLAANKPVYKVGEKLTLAVTTTQPCYLSVVAANSAGQVRQIFPSLAFPNSQLAAGQTVLLSGDAAPQAVIAIGPASETISALCTTEPRTLPAIKAGGEVAGPAEKAAIERDLAVVPTRPAGTTGFAQITLAIVP